jgi:hypothetical protein
MPTAVKTKADTKEKEEVIVDVKLNKLVENWDKLDEQQGGAWMQIAKYVRDKQITSAQIINALVEIRGLKPTSARVEASRFMRFSKSQEASDMLDEAMSGDSDVTVRDLRGAGVLTGSKAEVDPTEAYGKKLLSVAKYAIEKAEITEMNEFLAEARRAFKTAYKKASARDTSGNGDDAGDADDDDGE